jgi:hypothetical protein
MEAPFLRARWWFEVRGDVQESKHGMSGRIFRYVREALQNAREVSFAGRQAGEEIRHFWHFSGIF